MAMPNLIRDNMRIEHLIGRKVKASLGQAQGVGKTEKRAKDACEAAVLSIIQNERDTSIEIRDGYLIVSGVTDADEGWYIIKRLADTKNGYLHPQCFMRASGLKAAIEAHLAQYKADDACIGARTPEVNLPANRNCHAPVDMVAYTGEPMQEGFSVFNCHINNAKERSKALFVACFGQDKWDREIQPFHNKGIMTIFHKKPTKYVQWYVDTVTAIVNEHATEKDQKAK